MQTQGTLHETDLASLLQTMQSERATGTLSLESGGNTCSLYFLFGHLFHAADDRELGEDVVIRALHWSSGTFTFDPRAKLPAEETIKSAPADLIAEAVRRDPGFPLDPGHGGAQAGTPSGGGGDDSSPEPGWVTGGTPAESPPIPAAPWAPRDTPTYPPPAPAERPESRGDDDEPFDPAPPGATPPHRLAATASPMVIAQTAPVDGAPRALRGDVVYPFPEGKAVYERLKSTFVDFPKLLLTLETDQHTGSIRLHGDGFSGSMLIDHGRVVDVLARTATWFGQGEEAFLRFQEAMDDPGGFLDVTELGSDTVIALHQCLTAPAVYTGLLGRFINFDALLEYLAEEHVDGSVIVITDSEIGIILLRAGAVVGSYTQSEPALRESTEAVAGLAVDRSSRIEVKGGESRSPAIDVAATLARSRA